MGRPSWLTWGSEPGSSRGGRLEAANADPAHPRGLPSTGRKMTEAQIVDELMRRARAAMTHLADATQERVDEAVTAIAWALYKVEHAHELAVAAVRDTGLGNERDKVVKNQRKTLG